MSGRRPLGNGPSRRRRTKVVDSFLTSLRFTATWDEQDFSYVILLSGGLSWITLRIALLIGHFVH